MSYAGTQAILTYIRQKFWILRGRKTIQHVITKCIQCSRHAAKRIESIPTLLPEDRIRDDLMLEVYQIRSSRADTSKIVTNHVFYLKHVRCME